MLRPIALLVTGLLAAGSLAACSSPSTGTAAAGAASQGAQLGYGGTGGAGQQRFPGTSGTIADITGSTLQVQNQTDGQVAVTYSGSTTFTAQVAAALSDVKVGSCVMVTPASSGSSGSSGSSAGSAPADAVTAGAVRISQPQNGSCTGGFGFARGAGAPSGGLGARPSGRPSDLPSGGPGSGPGSSVRGGLFGGASGTVASVTATGFTVTEERPDFSSGQPSPGATPSMTSSTVTVTVDAATTYSATRPATSSALKVGKCVNATGSADSTGAITATRIAITDPENGQCGGFGFVRAGQGGPGEAVPSGAAPGGSA